MKKVLSIFLLVLVSFALIGCGNTKENTKNDVSLINDNKSYFFKIGNKKFYAGDEISSITKLGYDLREVEKNESVPANKYMIGAGRIVNSDAKVIFNVTPYNPTSSSVNIMDSVIGGFTLDDYNIRYDEIVNEITVVGGLKLGSTTDEVKKVFGEPTSINELTSSTIYKYNSDELYREYKFTFDKDGKVTYITWQNLVFNK